LEIDNVLAVMSLLNLVAKVVDSALHHYEQDEVCSLVPVAPDEMCRYLFRGRIDLPNLHPDVLEMLKHLDLVCCREMYVL
jgi:hypothetical protein